MLSAKIRRIICKSLVFRHFYPLETPKICKTRDFRHTGYLWQSIVPGMYDRMSAHVLGTDSFARHPP